MSIANVKVSNFKSFKKIDLDIDNFNIIIGTNASGKSNFVSIFKFIKDIVLYDLDNAISMQGGLEYLTNRNIGPSKDLSFQFSSNDEYKYIRHAKSGNIGIKILQTIYSFSIKISEDMNSYSIVKDTLNFKCDFIKLEMPRKSERIIQELMFNNKYPQPRETDKISSGEIIISKIKDQVDVAVKDSPLERDEILPAYLRDIMMETPFSNSNMKDYLLIESPWSIIPIKWRGIFDNFSNYDFDPRLCKRAALITGKFDLEEDGNNLSIVLKHILENERKRELFFNLLKQILPFIEDINVDHFIDKSIIFKLKETYSEEYIAASFISDGTINIIALILALYFEEKTSKYPLIIFEEPERNMHPKLMSSIVSTIKDVSDEKQIIITTHNPGILKNTELNSILFISRDNNGFSKISRPRDNQEIKYFLKNNIGIEELFLNDLIQ